MPKCIIDGREAEFKPGENLIEVAKRVGVEIPVFCYHPGLTVVAQCRMCAVEIEKNPKLQTACSTPATEGMVVHTTTPKVVQNQKAIMEFLLINHPLDCPICDKAGDCDLQDNSYKFGSPYSRYTEERRTYLDLDMGPVIKKNMNRCIHCTRCIRFGDEIAGIREMVATKRGNWTEISTLNTNPLATEYAGNYADICPTGSLTVKDFRFKKRSWLLKKTPTICEGCSRGCAIEAQQDGNVVYRCLARENLAVNKYWICDEGRFNFHYVHDASRVLEPAQKGGASLGPTSWEQALEVVRDVTAGKKLLVLVGSDLTLEEGQQILDFAKAKYSSASVYHFGTPGIGMTKEDAQADPILKMKSKTSNLNGMANLGIKPFDGALSGFDIAAVFRGGRAIVPELKSMKRVGIGVFNLPQAEKYEAVLPSLSFLEKAGTIVNFQGIEQKLKPAIKPLGQSKAISEILMMWANGGKKV
ncbi:2Fe-2S iron-sulfur cluster-binding protein [Bdellovibrionota bacterium FG-2]